MVDADVVALLHHLIRFDTTNHGIGSSVGETPCAEWVAAVLSEAGYEPQVLWREGFPERGNVVNLMDALKASLGQAKPPAKSRSKAEPAADAEAKPKAAAPRRPRKAPAKAKA